MMTLNEEQEALRLASIKDRGDDGDEHSARTDKNRDESVEEMAWDLQIYMTRRVVIIWV